MTIAYQGEPGAFSEAAARHVAAGAELRACRAFEDVFDAVEGGEAAYGVLPIENSIGGSIHRNFDLMLQHELTIVGEVELPVVHQLLALPGTTLDQVRRIYSHPQALAQCDRFLRTLSSVEVIATYDTAGSAKLVADNGMKDAAAIASMRAAEVFGLVALRSSIQDFERNVGGSARQDLDRLRAAERSGRVVQGPERLRAARHRLDQTRVAADPGTQVGIPVLCRLDGARSGGVQPRSGASRRIRHDAPGARHVCELSSGGRRKCGRQSF
jgi:hypothetical protein